MRAQLVDGSLTYSFVGEPPAGMTVDPVTGTLSGTPVYVPPPKPLPPIEGPRRPPPIVLCPFCNGSLDIELYNGAYGCNTGCSYVRFEVDCPHCRREIYSKGEFGEMSGPHDEDDYRDQFMAEFAEAVQKINQERASQ
ncbi:putative Ig domain-containing protein [Mycolicibacterium sphagni]|nr:putative Ig domain-containing protein [Mycolicibacterium sphagni]